MFSDDISVIGGKQNNIVIVGVGHQFTLARKKTAYQNPFSFLSTIAKASTHSYFLTNCGSPK